MNNVKVSIVIPTLNRIDYIRNCLESAKKQTLNEIEVICIDAGSEDGTQEVIKEYVDSDSRFSMITSKRKSYGYQINEAIKIAKGDYITILESDDYLLQNACEDMYCRAQQLDVDYYRARVDLFISNGAQDDVYGFLNGYPKEYENIKYEGRDIIDKKIISIICILGTLYKKDFLVREKINANETNGASFQDVGFCLQVVSLAQSFAYSNKSVYRKRMDNETSSIHSVKDNIILINEYNYAKKLVEEKKVDEEFLYHQMITDYYWRFTISDESEQEKFLTTIRTDIKKAYKYNYLIKLNKDEVEKLKILDGNIENYRKIKNEIDDANELYTDLLFNGTKYVIVSAGKMSSLLATMNEKYNSKGILAICDNDEKKVGIQIGGITIKTVKDTVLLYPNAKYLIVNKNYSEEIKNQLISLGIKIDQIFIAKQAPSINQILLNTNVYISKQTNTGESVGS